MNGSYNILVDKLNSFRKRYYLYQLLRGLLISLALLIIVYVSISLFEYYFYSPSNIRKIEFYSLFVFFILIISHYIVVPVLNLLRLLNRNDKKNLNSIIVSHFVGIKDKLTNIIELAENTDDSYSNEIVIASIDQKINEIKIFDFNKAINFSNLKYIVLYFMVSVLGVLLIVIFDKPLLKESNHRIVNYQQPFQKPAPFAFVFESDSIRVSKGENLVLKVACVGKEIPEMVYLSIGGTNFLMDKSQNGNFEYVFDAVINDFDFCFTDLKYQSKTFHLTTLAKPGIQNFDVKIIAPKYTGLKNQLVNNIGDIKVPEGSLVEWDFNCIDTDTLKIGFQDKSSLKATLENNLFHLSKKIVDNTSYHIDLVNNFFRDENIISYSINVIKDLYPQINLVQVRDSMQYSRFYFKGSISDDYGFSGLNFHYNINEYDSIIPVMFIKSLKEQEYYFTFDFKDVGVPSGLVSYYFSVEDNDILNGYKSTTSDSYIYKIPSVEELSEMEEQQFAQIENLMDQGKGISPGNQEKCQTTSIKYH